jgi:hypothetical protein
MARTDGIGEYVPAGEMLATEQGQQDIVSAVGSASTTVPRTKLIEHVGQIIYIGEASGVGNATSSPTWKILRIDETAFPNVEMKFAGTGAYDQVWDDRLSLIYN